MVVKIVSPLIHSCRIPSIAPEVRPCLRVLLLEMLVVVVLLLRVCIGKLLFGIIVVRRGWVLLLVLWRRL